MLRLYLVRHGWTEWHSEGRVAGWAEVPLDERGCAEAEAAGRWLAARVTPRPALLVTSPVLRARQTAELISAAFEPALDMRVEPRLAETRVPEWQGQLSEEIVAADPRWPQFYQGPADFRFPGGETGREVQARVVAAAEALRGEFAAVSLVLVSHADPLRGLIAHYLGLEANHYYRLRLDCGSISVLSLSTQSPGGRPAPQARLELLNQTEHLRGAG